MMAVRDDLIEALSVCIDRLNQGETVNNVLADYPAIADQLRPMLEAGLLFSRVRFPADEVETAETAGEPVIRETVRQVFRGGFRWMRWMLLLLVLAGGLVFAIVWGDDRTDNAAVLVTETETPTSTLTHTPTHTDSPTAPPTATLTHTSTSPPTMTAAATLTPPPTSTPTTPSDLAQITITGPITAIEGNLITLYDLTITFEATDPTLSVVQIGDVVRVDGIFEAGVIQVITITFVDVLVIVQEGQVWRGDNCAVPPPGWAQALAGDWYARCVSAAPANNSPSGGSAGNSDSDNDDDDDDD